MNYLFKAHSSSAERRRLEELVSDVTNHPHRDELVNIMYQQVLDEQDTLGLST
jgi:hypothetical protein